MAVDALSDLGIWALTLHTSGGIPMMARAREAAHRNGETLLLGVTVLTSLAGEDWDRVHPGLALEEALRGRAEAAQEAGIDGVVCSPLDLPLINSTCNLMKVVPGIRPASLGDDQARVATPSKAIASGADYLVVGRPILKASDRRQATLAIKNSMREGFKCR
jgi:orotidine-5'-phosphate decarboxylase